MSVSSKVVIGSVVAACMALFGCAAENEGNVTDVAPDVDQPAMQTKQTQTYNGFTLNAQTPTLWMEYVPYFGNAWYAYGSIVISGGTGTQKQGACLLTLPSQSTFTPCNDVSTCPAPPSGGSSYCLAPNNSGQKYCWQRPGAQAGWCAGSPGNGGSAVGNGTYYTPTIQFADLFNNFITEGCVNACSGTTPIPSVSAEAHFH